MNILLLTESFPPNCGGSGWSTYQLFKSLKKAGCTVYVGKIKGKENSYERVQITPFQSIDHAINFIRDKKIEVIHSQHMQSTVWADKIHKITKTPFVVTIRDYWPFSFNGTLFDYKKEKNISKETLGIIQKSLSHHKYNWISSICVTPFLKLRTKKAKKSLNNAGKVICCSDFVKNKVSKIVNSKKIITIPNMLDLEELKNVKAKKMSIKGVKTIVFVGKLTANKGPQMIPKIVDKVKLGKDQIIHTIIIGEGPLKKNIENDFKERNLSYEILPYIDNKETLTYMKAADIVLLPAKWHEPLGRTILESIGVGALTVVSDTGGNPEIIQNEKNGFVCKGSEKEYAEKITKILRSKNIKRIRENAKKSAEEKYSDKMVVKKFIDVYKGVKL